MYGLTVARLRASPVLAPMSQGNDRNPVYGNLRWALSGQTFQVMSRFGARPVHRIPVNQTETSSQKSGYALFVLENDPLTINDIYALPIKATHAGDGS